MTVPNRPQGSPKIKGTVPRPPMGGRSRWTLTGPNKIGDGQTGTLVGIR